MKTFDTASTFKKNAVLPGCHRCEAGKPTKEKNLLFLPRKADKPNHREYPQRQFRELFHCQDLLQPGHILSRTKCIHTIS